MNSTTRPHRQKGWKKVWQMGLSRSCEVAPDVRPGRPCGRQASPSPHPHPVPGYPAPLLVAAMPSCLSSFPIPDVHSQPFQEHEWRWPLCSDPPTTSHSHHCAIHISHGSPPDFRVCLEPRHQPVPSRSKVQPADPQPSPCWDGRPRA